MKKVLFVLLLTLFWLICRSQENRSVTINLQTEKYKYLMGEEKRIWYEAVNNGDKNICMAYCLDFLSPVITVKVIDPKGKEYDVPKGMAVEWSSKEGSAYCHYKPKEKSQSHWIPAGFAEEGEYEIWVEYDSTSLNASWDNISILRAKIESNHIRFRVEKPSGIDLEAYNYFKGNPLNPQSSADLLQKYPTSTYAGYVLAERIPNYSSNLYKPVPPLEQVKLAREEGKVIESFPDKDFEKYFQQMEKAAKGGNIPKAVKSSFYCFYGDLLVQKGRFDEAEKAFSCALEEKPLWSEKEQAFYDRAEQFMNALRQSGKGEGVSKEKKKEETTKN